MEVVERYIMENIDELMKECAHVCREVGTVYVAILLNEDVVYEGCESCLITTALDHLGMPSITLRTLNGELMEFTLVNDYVFESIGSSVTIYRRDSLTEHLRDLVDFGVIDEESMRNAIDWLNNLSRG